MNETFILFSPNENSFIFYEWESRRINGNNFLNSKFFIRESYMTQLCIILLLYISTKQTGTLHNICGQNHFFDAKTAFSVFFYLALKRIFFCVIFALSSFSFFSEGFKSGLVSWSKLISGVKSPKKVWNEQKSLKTAEKK